MKKPFLLLLTVIILAGSFVYIDLFWKKAAKESIIFFPIDQEIKIESPATNLRLLNEKDNDEYIVNWEVMSRTSEPVYLRQDISLLFADGRLAAIISEWQDNKQELLQYATYSGEDSSRFLALSFHHGEIHHSGDKITSTHKMSKDFLYVIDSSFSPLQSFKEAETPEQTEWKEVLDRVTAQQLEFYWEKAIDNFNIPINHYSVYTLEELIDYQESGLPEIDPEQSKIVIGRLWEGLYKEYFLGIKTAAGTTIPPIGSSLPLILISDDYSQLVVLFETSEGESIKLTQRLSDE